MGSDKRYRIQERVRGSDTSAKMHSWSQYDI